MDILMCYMCAYGPLNVKYRASTLRTCYTVTIFCSGNDDYSFFADVLLFSPILSETLLLKPTSVVLTNTETVSSLYT